MATPHSFSLQIHIYFPLGNFLPLESSHSGGANSFPLCWETGESGSQAMGSSAVCCSPQLCEAPPQHPIGPVRAHGNSRMNFLLSLLSSQDSVLAKYFIACVVLSILSSMIILSSVYSEFPACKATCFLPFPVVSKSEEKICMSCRLYVLYLEQCHLVLLLEISARTRYLHCLLFYDHQLPGCMSLKYLYAVPEKSN